MENVNQVRFGNYTIGNFGAKQSEKKENSEENKVTEAKTPQTNVNPEEFLSAMNIAGLQNKIQVDSVSKKEVNPADHLSDERVADIEAMMEEFDNGVNAVSEFLVDEFPGMSEADRNTLAAATFARE